MNIDQSDASQLLGKKVGRWHVIKKRIKTDDDRSGAFSSCYEVKDEEGNIGFLKSFNIRYALRQAGGRTMDNLRDISDRFIHERDLINLCKEIGMSRVVTAIDYGDYQPEQSDIPIPYLVFEIADGSLKNINFLENPELVWNLRVFHGVLVGTSQLHQEKIAHQDIKPSNILIFGKNYSKISDLGSATQFGSGLKWNEPEDVRTDLRYIPIELLYGYFSPDWNTRRFGGDLFMLGGLLSYVLTGTNILSYLFSKLQPDLLYFNYQGTYREALPNIIMAFHDTIRDIRSEIPTTIRQEITEIIYQLSHPQPEKRGNPERFKGSLSQYSLRRYISIIDRIINECGATKL